VTLVILAFVFNFVSSMLDPIVTATEQNVTNDDRNDLLLKGLAVVTLVVVVLVIGVLAEHTPTDGKVARVFHESMESIPAVGSVYTGFRQMSEVVVESDADSFQDVKLVEFPTEGSYTLAFVTADTPGNVEDATGHDEMVTLFMPMAPNPVMGGHVLHVSRDRVVDIDLTVEEGIQSIVTSGVTVGGQDRAAELSPDEIAAIGRDGSPSRYEDGEDEVYEPREVSGDRIEEYDEDVDAVHRDTPERLVDREREHGDPDGERPSEVADREASERDSTDRRPSEIAGRDPDDRDPTDSRPAEAASRREDYREETERRPAELAGGDDGTDEDEDEDEDEGN
jgi:uncharacterized membrane protein